MKYENMKITVGCSRHFIGKSRKLLLCFDAKEEQQEAFVFWTKLGYSEERKGEREEILQPEDEMKKRKKKERKN